MRRGTQIARVYTVLLDGDWHTLGNIAERTGDPEPSISAQIRHLRKDRFGNHIIEYRHVQHGLWEYRLVR